jgi:hypothetical protein
MTPVPGWVTFASKHGAVGMMARLPPLGRFDVREFYVSLPAAVFKFTPFPAFNAPLTPPVAAPAVAPAKPKTPAKPGKPGPPGPPKKPNRPGKPKKK